MTEELFQPLPREEVIKAVERRRPRRIPLIRAKWWGEGLAEQYGDRLEQFDRYPEDVAWLWLPDWVFDPGQMNLSWYDPSADAGKALDARPVLDTWDRLDEFIAKLPDPEAPGMLDDLHAKAAAARAEGRYVLFACWRMFFERPWQYRGMENLMLDYYLNPDKVHRLHEALCRMYVGLIRRAKRELAPDGYWTSDDLGNQRQLMMRAETFGQFLLPYYRRVGAACRQAGLHLWLHSCGNNTVVMGDLADAGVNVFHPVQKHTMDERAIARDFGGRMAFLAGLDVQHILREGAPDQVRAEVRYLVDTFDQPDGGLCLAAGNGIVGGTPFENIDAFLDEAVRYGAAHRAWSV
jgi:uroporphyrinogen decarboxylase